MAEEDFIQAAAQRQGIACVLYPPRERSGKPILQTRQEADIAGHWISEGRWTDGGSVPRALHGVAHPFGYLFRAYLLHDTLLFDGYGWERANARFEEALIELGAPSWQRLLITSGVGANARWQYVRAWLGWEADYVGDDARPRTKKEQRRIQALSSRPGT